MMILLATLAVLSDSTATDSALAEVRETRASAVRLWLSNDRRFRDGERVRVQVDADVSGFLLVLNYSPEGRLQVLFPLDPRDDSRIEAGRRYEIRSESNTGAFRAGGDGTGFVYSAVSSEPWRLGEITLADRWDATRLEISREAEDPEDDVTALVQRMAGSDGFDYDVLGYRVYGETIAYNTYVYPRGPTYIYDDYLYCNNWSWRYDGCRRWPYDGGWSISFGYGYGYPYYYDSFGRYRYNYGYGQPYYYPYHTTYPYFPRGPRANIVGRPRNYDVIPRSNNFGGSPRNGAIASRGGNVGGGGFPVSGTGTARGPRRGDGAGPDFGGRARGPARPSREGVGRGSNDYNGPSNVAPPARRANGGGEFDGSRRAGPGNREAPSRPRGEPSRREAPPEARGEPSSRRGAPPEARGEPSSRRGAPPEARGEPSRRDPPPARTEPRRGGSEPQQVRGNGGGNGGARGGGGHSGGGGGGGGRPRRP